MDSGQTHGQRLDGAASTLSPCGKARACAASLRGGRPAYILADDSDLYRRRDSNSGHPLPLLTRPAFESLCNSRLGSVLARALVAFDERFPLFAFRFPVPSVLHSNSARTRTLVADL